MGKFIFTIPAKPFMGKIKCAFRDSWENLFFPCRGFATPGEKSYPCFSTPRVSAIDRMCSLINLLPHFLYHIPSWNQVIKILLFKRGKCKATAKADWLSEWANLRKLFKWLTERVKAVIEAKLKYSLVWFAALISKFYLTYKILEERKTWSGIKG